MDMTEVRRFDQAQVGTITLSEAIRIGAGMSDERREGFWVYEDGRHKCCAIAAAALALGYKLGDPWSLGLEQRYGEIVSYASDRHFRSKESREEIADWLETQGY